MSEVTAAHEHDIHWQSRTTAQEYDARRFTSWGGRWFNQVEQAAIGRLLDLAGSRQAVRTVLDLPSGTGRISELLCRRGHEVTCGDISESMLEVAREKLRSFTSPAPKFTVLDVYRTGCDDATFDCVTCIRLFQHLTSDERAAALTELGRISRRWVIVNVMYTSGYYGLLRGLRKLLGRYAPRQTTSRRQLERELSQAGMRVVQSVFPQPLYNGNRVLLLEKIAS